MATCFANNIYCLYFPAHTSHGLQPWDNGPFAVEKGAYRRELSQLSSLNDSTNGGKIQFMNCLIEARKAVTPAVMKGGFRHTGNWPISRAKALRHPEIQMDKEKRKAAELAQSEASGDESEPVTYNFITKLGRGRDHEDRRKLRKVANKNDDLTAENILLQQEILSLRAQIKNITKGKKRRAIPNPNKRFQRISDIIAAGGNPNEAVPSSSSGENSSGGEDLSSEGEGLDEAEDEPEPAVRSRQATRVGRQTQIPARYR